MVEKLLFYPLLVFVWFIAAILLLFVAVDHWVRHRQCFCHCTICEADRSLTRRLLRPKHDRRLGAGSP